LASPCEQVYLNLNLGTDSLSVFSGFNLKEDRNLRAGHLVAAHDQRSF